VQPARKEYGLTSSTSSYPFLVSDVILQFPITSLWDDCRLRVA